MRALEGAGSGSATARSQRTGSLGYLGGVDGRTSLLESLQLRHFNLLIGSILNPLRHGFDNSVADCSFASNRRHLSEDVMGAVIATGRI